WEHNPAETTRWEVFQGRLLDPAHTREEATFESWNIHHEIEGALSPEPILSLKLDAADFAGVDFSMGMRYEAEQQRLPADCMHECPITSWPSLR
ncbi:MAG: hypothetical protein HC872_08355, partial [Gammaproteobacteria bacterium]|nr:hypothetical protein [Gammaproteobacteria bacterium]